MKLTRRKFFFGGAIAAVAVPILAFLPSRRAASGVKTTPGLTYLKYSDIVLGADAELWSGGAVWVNHPTDTVIRARRVNPFLRDTRYAAMLDAMRS